jgi:hypothetical protein
MVLRMPQVVRLMAGAYCQYCDQRCFVDRQVIVAGVVVWSGHMATCARGMEHDRAALGVDHTTAHNPRLRDQR